MAEKINIKNYGCPETFNLVDIQNVFVNKSLTKNDRINQYIQQIKDPYCYKCDDMIIHIKFTDSENKLQDCMTNYIKNSLI